MIAAAVHPRLEQGSSAPRDVSLRRGSRGAPGAPTTTTRHPLMMAETRSEPISLEASPKPRSQGRDPRDRMASLPVHASEMTARSHTGREGPVHTPDPRTAAHHDRTATTGGNGERPRPRPGRGGRPGRHRKRGGGRAGRGAWRSPPNRWRSGKPPWGFSVLGVRRARGGNLMLGGELHVSARGRDAEVGAVVARKGRSGGGVVAWRASVSGPVDPWAPIEGELGSMSVHRRGCEPGWNSPQVRRCSQTKH